MNHGYLVHHSVLLADMGVQIGGEIEEEVTSTVALFI